LAIAPAGLVLSERVVGVRADEGAVVDGAVVDGTALATPPWWEQAPLPVVVAVVPSLHVTVPGDAAACADLDWGVASQAVATARVKSAWQAIFIMHSDHAQAEACTR